MRCDDRDNNTRKAGATFPLWLRFMIFQESLLIKDSKRIHNDNDNKNNNYNNKTSNDDNKFNNSNE